LKDFAKPIRQSLLDIEDKKRSNLFAWRGQFSPQLIECLLDAYCPPGSVVLDPFAGSGTVMLEAARMSLAASAFEINPSAWSFSKLYEFANLPCDTREIPIAGLRNRIQAEFPIVIFSHQGLPTDEVERRLIRLHGSTGDKEDVLYNAWVVLLDLYRNHISSDLVRSKFTHLCELVRRLPYSMGEIKADLQDARSLPLQNQSVDFVITSPPYINVFNYHQNYRQSAELLGWDLLRVARSEIGSNRANRGNRFLTVIQYSIDMADALHELARVLRPGGRAVFIVGYESRVLGAPFYNAEIVERIARELQMFEIVLHQQRVFTNRFGRPIREDILNLRREAHSNSDGLGTIVGRRIAEDALNSALTGVCEKNRPLLLDALSRVSQIDGTPIFNSASYAEYQSRDCVTMAKERMHL